jgi:hypothetical protein
MATPLPFHNTEGTMSVAHIWSSCSQDDYLSTHPVNIAESPALGSKWNKVIGSFSKAACALTTFQLHGCVWNVNEYHDYLRDYNKFSEAEKT